MSRVPQLDQAHAVLNVSTLADDSRVHIATRADLFKPGGLHGVVRGLAEGQGALGLRPEVLHQIKRPVSTASAIWRPPLEQGQSSRSDEPVTRFNGPLIEYHFAQAAQDALKDREIARIPSIFHFHGPWFKEGRVQGDPALRVLAKRILESRTYRRFTAFTVHSRAFKAELIENFGVSDEQIRVVHPGIDTERFVVGDRQWARGTLGVDPYLTTFATVRRLEPRMGLDLAIKAMTRFPDAQLIIAGQGSLRASLERLADDHNVSSRVHFLGRVTDEQLVTVYQAGDVVVVPTRALEGFGLIVLEAFAAGTPVIASRVGGLPEAMGPWADEWTFEPDDFEGLVDRMAAAIQSGPSSASLRTEAESHSWAHVAREIESLALDRLVR